MYGYVVPDKPNLLMKEYALYRAYYCGVCKHTGRIFGQWPRFATNYDIAFLAAFAHDFTEFVPEIKRQGCVLNPFKKKDIIMGSPLMDKIAAANIIMGYYKLTDDVIDKSGKGRRFVRSLIKRGYKKAKKMLPELDDKIKAQYERLRGMENERQSSIDLLADCSAKMLEDAVAAVIGSVDERVNTLAYNLGKWVYLVDAVDDLEEDFKKKRFNPLLNIYGGFTGRTEFIRVNSTDINFLLNTCINSMTEALGKIPRGHSAGLIDNIIFKGLRAKTKQLLESAEKLPAPRI